MGIYQQHTLGYLLVSIYAKIRIRIIILSASLRLELKSYS